MSMPCKFERSILSFDEHQLVTRSHHPEIYESGRDAVRGRSSAENERTTQAGAAAGAGRATGCSTIGRLISAEITPNATPPHHTTS